MKKYSQMRMGVFTLFISASIQTCLSQITVDYGTSTGVVSLDYNHIGAGNLYTTPSASSSSQSFNPSLSDDHTISLYEGEYVHGLFSLQLNETARSNTLTLSGQISSKCDSVEVSSSPIANQVSASTTCYHSTAFTITQPMVYHVTCSATSSGRIAGAAISLFQIFPYTGGGAPIKQFNIGSGQIYDGNSASQNPTAPGSLSGTLQPGSYTVYVKENCEASGISSSSASIGIAFELGVTNSPPRLFILAIGFNDGIWINGYKDAQKVFNIYRNRPNFASASLGNTTSALEITDNDTNAKETISNILSRMVVRPQDTVVFYYSGHGGINPANGHTSIFLGGQDLWDSELASIFQNNQNLRVARKIFILDSCHSGGFAAPFLFSLNNFALLAAASQNGFSYAYTYENPLKLGRGIYTEDILLPYLQGKVSFQDLARDTYQKGVFVNQNLAGATLFLKEPAGSVGQFSFSGMAVASTDFDATQWILAGPEVPARIRPGVQILWPTTNGALYQVQCTDSLTPILWNNFGDPVNGDGTEKGVSDPVQNNQQRFYRIVQLQ